MSAHAEERQYKVEAAFLYNFLNYVTWPNYESPQMLADPIICIYGDDPIVPYLYYVQSKMSTERSMTIRKVYQKHEARGCHILFMRNHMSRYGLDNDTLTVFKPDDPLDRGGMIELTEEGERITLRIDQSQLEQKGFQVSSRLLDLARRVK